MTKKQQKIRQRLLRGKAVQPPAGIRQTATAQCVFSGLDRYDLMAAFLPAAGMLIVYWLTLCPTVFVQDSGEFSTVAATWGVAHPPGYPLYSLLCAVFARVLPIGTFALRSNLFSAVCGSVALALLFLVCRRLGASRPAAGAAALCLGAGVTFWSQAVVAEVYCLDILLVFAALLALFYAMELPARGSFFLCGLAAGFMAGHRPVNILMFAPVVIACMEAARRKVNLSLGAYVYCLAGILISGLVFAYLPIASFLNPPVDMGDPETVERFRDAITAKPYQRYFNAGSPASELARVGAFLWDLPANTGIAAIVAPLGLWVLWKKHGWLLSGGLLFSVFFCVGFSAKYNVIDSAVFFLPAVAILAVAASLGFDWLLRRFVWAALLLGVAGLPLNYQANDLSQMRFAEQLARDALTAAAPQAIILSESDTASKALVYIQSVEGVRPDVAVISTGMLTSWYIEQLRRTYPHVSWPIHEPEYYVKTSPNGSTVSWLREFMRSNVASRDMCMLTPPELQLQKPGMSEFEPGWHEIPQGILYCIENPDRPYDPTERIAATEAFWKQCPVPGWKIPDGADVQLSVLAFNYIMARFAFAVTLVDRRQIDAAMNHLQAIVAAQPDRIEEAITRVYQRADIYIPLWRLGARAQKAIAAPSGDRAAILAALSGT